MVLRLYGDAKPRERLRCEEERLNRALNPVVYTRPLSVEGEDAGMDCEHDAAEACAFIRQLDFAPSAVVLDAQFARGHQHRDAYRHLSGVAVSYTRAYACGAPSGS
ncbi:MAG: hypothetical protein HKN04_05730 [Rhodothermaceae bacterium]|nr:hypothetical protein [Rhodothermaceae bacterium]